MTFEERLIETKNRPSGFDYLRISLAIAVIASHAPLVCYGFDVDRAINSSPLVRPFVFFIVPSFFALSGFLVAGSLERNSLVRFLSLRAVRIFPALAVEILLSALLIGPIVTSIAWHDYFSSRLFFRYFMNVVGYIQYFLPGVFLNNPAPAYVNLQLWTVPRELDCYLLISAVSIIGLYKRPRLLLGALAVTSVGIFLYQEIFNGYGEHDGQARGALTILSFLCGVSFYGLRSRIPFNKFIFLLSLATVAICLSFEVLTNLAPLPIAYLTIYLGLLNPKRLAVIRGADYSYGMYLYGFPIQQLIVWAIPSSRIWYVNLVLSIAIAAGCAFLSWTAIESPINEKRNAFASFVEGLLTRKKHVEAKAV